MKSLKKIIYFVFFLLGRNRIFRKIILKILIKIHNLSYKSISSIAAYSGTHPKHEITNYHQFFLDNVNKLSNVLDIGCGNGDVAYDLSKKVQRVVGMDISKKNIETAKKRYDGDNLEFVLGDATKYPFENSFDVIVLSNVLEHIKDRISFLKKTSNIAPRLLIRVPLITRDWISVYKKEIGQEYRLSKDHYIEYTEEIFQEEMEKSGLKIDKYHVKFGELYAVVSK